MLPRLGSCNKFRLVSEIFRQIGRFWNKYRMDVGLAVEGKGSETARERKATWRDLWPSFAHRSDDGRRRPTCSPWTLATTRTSTTASRPPRASRSAPSLPATSTLSSRGAHVRSASARTETRRRLWRSPSSAPAGPSRSTGCRPPWRRPSPTRWPSQDCWETPAVSLAHAFALIRAGHLRFCEFFFIWWTFLSISLERFRLGIIGLLQWTWSRRRLFWPRVNLLNLTANQQTPSSQLCLLLILLYAATSFNTYT